MAVFKEMLLGVCVCVCSRLGRGCCFGKGVLLRIIVLTELVVLQKRCVYELVVDGFYWECDFCGRERLVRCFVEGRGGEEEESVNMSRSNSRTLIRNWGVLVFFTIFIILNPSLTCNFTSLFLKFYIKNSKGKTSF